MAASDRRDDSADLAVELTGGLVGFETLVVEVWGHGRSQRSMAA